jgi:DNA primase
MRFSPSFLDEIRNRLPVSAVVGKRVALKKQGREWRGLSPFNKEKTPSFYVNDQKGFYHCFSSGKHGDQFSFLMEVEGLSFPEAVERLAGEAGLALPKLDPEDIKREEKVKSLIEIIELATQFFEQQLREPAGIDARTYLVQRELTIETQKEFRIGYAPNSKYALKEFLSGKNISLEDMISAGLLIAGDDISIPYDRFRDRLMFPIQNSRGQVIAFGGRALSKDAQAKYLNSPETPLFHKGAQLYNLHRARASAHTSEKLVLVEGYIDAITLFQAGYSYVVAPLGTAFTEDQLKLLWRLADTPVFCFDGDAAGLRAAERAMDIALPHLSAGKSLSFALLPAGLDPDDFIRQRGNEAFDAVLASAEPLASLLWERETRARDLRTPEQRAALEKRLREILHIIQDAIVRKYYEAEFSAKLKILIAPRNSSQHTQAPRLRPQSFQNNRNLLEPSAALKRSRIGQGSAANWPLAEALILAAAYYYPLLIEMHAEDFAALELSDPELSRLRDVLLQAPSEREIKGEGDLNGVLEALGLEGSINRLLGQISQFSSRFLAQNREFHEIQADFIRMVTLHRRNSTLNKELAQAQAAIANEMTEESFAKFQVLQQGLFALQAEMASSTKGDEDETFSLALAGNNALTVHK